jgi:hypothetical protein
LRTLNTGFLNQASKVNVRFWRNGGIGANKKGIAAGNLRCRNGFL